QSAPWYESAIFNRAVIGGSLALLVLTVVLWPVAGLIRWHYGIKMKTQQGSMRRIVLLAALAYVVFAGVWILSLSSLGDPGKLNNARDTIFRLMQIPGWIGAIGTIAALFYGIGALSGPGRWWWSRLHAVALAVAFVAFTWFVYHWHMLAFSLKF